jgi:hypothetical protein
MVKQTSQQVSVWEIKWLTPIHRLDAEMSLLISCPISELQLFPKTLRQTFYFAGAENFGGC